MSLKKQMFYITFLVLVVAWLFSTPSSANAATKQWHTLVTGLSGETEITTQIYGYAKDTPFGEIVVECDEETGEDTGFAFLNSRIGEKEIVLEDREETFVDWENPRTLNFLECQILAPNIPLNVDWDYEYHWEHMDEPMHYKPGPPIWPGDPSWALLAPDVPNNMLVVVEATNPNPYPVSTKIRGSVPIEPKTFGGYYYIEDEANIEFAAGETKYLKLPNADRFLAQWPEEIAGKYSYSTAGWTTSEYQILSDEYPPEWVINGSTTIDVPPYGTPGWNWENMTYHPVYGRPPEEVPTPFNLGDKRYEPNWTRNCATSGMSQNSGAWDTWEAAYTPITGPAVVTNNKYRDFNMFYLYRGDMQIFVPRGSYIDTQIQRNYWWPYNNGWNNWLPILVTDEALVWAENYSFSPVAITPPYVPGDGCNPGYQPPDEIMNYGQLVSTPQIQYSIRRAFTGRPSIKNQIQINACTVEVVDTFKYGDYGCGPPQQTIKSHYTWNGSSFTRTQSTTPYAGETVGTGKVTMTFTNLIQAQNPSSLTVNFGQGGQSCVGYSFTPEPQTIHLPHTAQFDASLTEKVGVKLPKRVITPPYVPGDGCIPGYQPPDEYYDLLEGDITIDLSIPSGQNTTIHADQFTVEMAFESRINIDNLASVLNTVSTPDEVIFTDKFTAEYVGADAAQIWGIWRHWRGGGERPWGDYCYDLVGFHSGEEKSASSYYSGSNPHIGQLSATPGASAFIETYSQNPNNNSTQAYYFRILDTGGYTFPRTYNPEY